MREEKHTADDLKIMQSLPLEIKEKMSLARIRSWVKEYGEDGCFISYSGGKDSTVLRHLVKRYYPRIPAVYVDTGLEYPEVRSMAMKNADEVLKPRMNFRSVIERYGYPVISKEQSRLIYQFKNTKSDYLARNRLYGLRRNGQISKFKISNKHQKLLYAPFDISDSCCDKLKKDPVRRYKKESGRKEFVGTMAQESVLRKQSWIRYGCNNFDGSNPKSAPLSFWTDNDILHYIVKYDLEIPSVYGDIIDDGDGVLTTTGVKRTGCIFCMYGVHMESCPNRFQLLKTTHPKLWNYCVYGGSNSGKDGRWRPTKEGLGMWKVFDYIGVPYE